MLRQSTAQCTRQMRLPLFSFPYAWITTNLPLIWTDCQLAQVAHINGSILPIFRIKPKQKSILSPYSMIFIISWTYDNIMVINHPIHFSFMTSGKMTAKSELTCLYMKGMHQYTVVKKSSWLIMTVRKVW